MDGQIVTWRAIHECIQLPAASPATVPAQQRSRREVEVKTRSSSAPCLSWRGSTPPPPPFLSTASFFPSLSIWRFLRCLLGLRGGPQGTRPGRVGGLGAVLGAVAPPRSLEGARLNHLWSFWAGLGAVLETSWGDCSPSCGVLEPPWARFGALLELSWAVLEASRGPLKFSRCDLKTKSSVHNKQ